MEQKKRWTDCLDSAVYQRLCNCRTVKADLPQLVNARWSYIRTKNARYTKEDALIQVLELLDCNGFDYDLTLDEYNELKAG